MIRITILTFSRDAALSLPEASDAYKAAIEQYKQDVASARMAQWRNRCVSDGYEPGSTFKPCTAIASLTEGIINTGTTIECRGQYTRYAQYGFAPYCWIYTQNNQKLTHGYLNVTGGICPIVDCSKSLVNGQCGGAKNGKCEIDPKKDCAWEKIYQRLEKQGRTKEFLDQPIQLRDYSVTNVDEIKAYVAQARAKRYEGFYGGVHPTENKEFTEHLALQKFPEPDTVIIPLAMHIGAPANPVVQPGDTVKVGQLIGEQAGFISAPVHSSVSGTVIAVEPHTHPNKGPGVMSVVIKNDGKNTLHESVVPNKPLEELTPDEIVEIVKEKSSN